MCEGYAVLCAFMLLGLSNILLMYNCTCFLQYEKIICIHKPPFSTINALWAALIYRLNMCPLPITFNKRYVICTSCPAHCTSHLISSLLLSSHLSPLRSSSLHSPFSPLPLALLASSLHPTSIYHIFMMHSSYLQDWEVIFFILILPHFFSTVFICYVYSTFES